METRFTEAKRAQWVAALEKWDFGDGGAYDDIPVLQYPPSGLGRPSAAPLRKPVTLESVRMAPPATAKASQHHVVALSNSNSNSGSGVLTLSSSTGAGTRPAATTAAPAGSRLMMAQTAESQLVVKAFAPEELARPDAAAIERERLVTESALEALIEKRRAEATGAGRKPQVGAVVRVVELEAGTSQNTRVAAIAEARVDPFDPKTRKLVKKQQSSAVDTAPVIRSPTKKPANNAEFPVEADFKLPGLVMQWSNPKGKIISLADREKADGSKHVTHALGSGHALNRSALLQAERELEEEARNRADAARQLEEERQKAEHDKLEQRAREAVAATQARGAARKGPLETAEERNARRQEEAELRERKREEIAKQRRLEVTAKRIGVDVESINEDEVMRRKILESAPVTESGELDPRLVHAKGSSAAWGAGGDDGGGEEADEQGGSSASLYAAGLFSHRAVLSDTVDAKAVQAEIDRQNAAAGQGGHAPQVVLGNLGDDDDDAFGVDELLR